ncbi:MAG: phage tail assembly protein [Vampirovibrio sp.]
MNATIKLEYPFDFQGQKITSLTLRRPKVIDRITSEKAEGSELQKEIVLFANLCGVEVDVIYALDQQDYYKISEAFAGFFTKTTAEASSTPL